MSGKSSTTVITESLADSLLAEFGRRRVGGSRGHWGRYAGVHDQGIAAAYDVEVAALLRNAPWLRQAVRAASRTDGEGKAPSGARERLIRRLDEELRNGQSHVRLSLEALLGATESVERSEDLGDEPVTTAGRQGEPVWRGVGTAAGRPAAGLRRLMNRRLFVPILLLNGTIAVPLVAGPVLHALFGTALPQQDGRLIALSAAGVWALGFMPGWLFVRFLDRRAGALWDEYVIHLHRLGLDEPGNLPEPARTSSFHEVWAADGGTARRWMRNLYREKFDAYYGRSVSRFGTDVDRPVKPEALFPIFLCTGVLATGWTAILYDPGATFGDLGALSIGAGLSFGFMGAYVFFLQVLLRRYFQADLRAGTYVAGYVRTVTALLIVVVLYNAVPAATPAELMVATAFVVGFFPDVGLRWLTRTVARRLRSAVPSVDAAYPLNRVDGLNVWYEARLLEEGIEDLQNLMTAKIVDVLLHTRVPVARLVDWVDQALLLIHLPAEPLVHEQTGGTLRRRSSNAAQAGSSHPRLLLRECGIRSATGLLRALRDERDPARRTDLLGLLEERGFAPAAVLSLRDILAADRRLAVVFNWQNGDSEPRAPLPLEPLAAR